MRQGIANYFKYVEEAWDPAITHKGLMKASWLVLVGNLALWGGYALPPAEQLGKKLAGRIQGWAQIDISVSEIRIWVAFLIGIAVRLYLLLFGIGGYFSSSTTRVAARSFIQYLNLFEDLATLAMVIYFCVQLAKSREANWSAFGVMLVVELFTVFIFGFKGQVLFRFFYLAVAYAYVRRTPPLQLILSGAIVLVLIFSVNLTMRAQYWQSRVKSWDISTIVAQLLQAVEATYAEQPGGEGVGTALTGNVKQVLRRLYHLEQFAMAVQYVDRTGQTLEGEMVRNFLFSFIPRVIWPGKPITSRGNWFRNVVYGRDDSSSAAITVPGYLYLNFGWLGVPLGFLFFGALQRVIITTVLHAGGNLRLSALVPFVYWYLALPTSELNNHLVGMIRYGAFLAIALTLLLPKVKTAPLSGGDFPQFVSFT